METIDELDTLRGYLKGLKDEEDKKKAEAPKPPTLGSIAQWWATTAVYGLPIGLITLYALNRMMDLAHIVITQALSR